MVAQNAQGAPLWRCSRTLLSSRLFLTAGHCTEAPAAHVELWFDSDVESGIPENAYPNTGDVGGTPHTHPSYNPNAFYLFDLGVVVLDEPVNMSTYGKLPTLNALDSLKPVVEDDIHRRWLRPPEGVPGRGVLEGAGPAHPDGREPASDSDQHGLRGRLLDHAVEQPAYGWHLLRRLRRPNFIGTSNVLGGVTSYGLNSNCAGTGGVYRVDRADDLNWLNGTFGAYLP
jgi:Trypsin